MDEKKTQKEQEQSNTRKKAYTPPALTMYGKLSELTGAGTGTSTEQGSQSMSKRP